MKLFHLNIEKGRFYKDILRTIRMTAPDIICFQEVAGGEYVKDGDDLFKKLQQDLSQYRGVLAKQNEPLESPQSYIGVAIFYKPELLLLKSKEVVMLRNSGKFVKADDPMNMHCGYKALALKLKQGDQVFNIVTGHFTWENKPDDNAYKIERAAKVLKYLKKLSHPFILTGDFNVKANTKTVKQFEQIAVNLTEKFKIGNTLNPNLSRHKHIFPKGVDCDHILISKGVKVKTYELIDEPDLSDHYALIMEFSLDPAAEKV